MAHTSARVERSRGAAGNPLPSIVSVALLTAALGGLLAHNAHWAAEHVVAALIGYAAIGAVVALTLGLGRASAGFGLANQVTLLRAGLVCLVGGALLAGAPAAALRWSLAALTAVALSLDALDGWLARRLGLASCFGARFDLEIDALLLLILALLVWQAGQVGPWVLAIGFLRYLFVLAGWLQLWLRRPLPPSRRRQMICVQQGITLLLCLLPPVGAALAGLMAGLALLALLASFAIDIIYLARARAAERRAAILNGARTAPYSRGLRRRPGQTHDPAKARTAWMGPMSAMSRGDRA
jgi:phosphatidylglycerophosphate synthase